MCNDCIHGVVCFYECVAALAAISPIGKNFNHMSVEINSKPDSSQRLNSWDFVFQTFHAIAPC